VRWPVTFLEKKKVFEEVTSVQYSAGAQAQSLGEDPQIPLDRQFLASLILSLTSSFVSSYNI